jgi:3'-5' exoribonuclease
MKIFISDFVANQTVSTTFLVKSKELRNKKAGGQYLTLTLADRTGEIVGNWWDNFEESLETFESDDVVFARGLVSVHRNRLQLTVHRVRPCQEREVDLTHYFPTTKHCVEAMFAELMGIVAGFENYHLRRLLESIFADEATVRKFKRAPAAKSMHHPYLGGLLEHTLSLVKLCRKVGAHYDGLDLDLLQTGAVLHDFGKIDELSYERGTSYTNDGQMLGHLAMETIFVSDKIRELPGFPEDLRRHLLHMLLAHHGKLEYGSPKLPLTPEALMLAYLDDLDSKIEAMQRLISEPHATGDWTRVTPMFERPIYRRRTLETTAPPSAESNAAQPALFAAAQNGQAGEATSRAADGVASAGQSRRPGGVRSDSFNTPFEQLADLMKDEQR